MIELDPAALSKLGNARERLFDGISRSLEDNGACKSYEGAFAIGLPNYFGGDWSVSLDCYVIGPNRHYSWSAHSLAEAVDRAAADIDKWMDEFDHWYADEQAAKLRGER